MKPIRVHVTIPIKLHIRPSLRRDEWDLYADDTPLIEAESYTVCSNVLHCMLHDNKGFEGTEVAEVADDCMALLRVKNGMGLGKYADRGGTP